MIQTVLAIDVGYKNLAFCVMRGDCQPLHWEVRSCTSVLRPTATEAREGLLHVLDTDVSSILRETPIDQIVIEQQVRGNNIMGKLEQVLHTWFHCMAPTTPCASMSSKLKLSHLGQDKGKCLKRAAVEECTRLLTQNMHHKVLERFQAHRKRDDLADTFLMARFVLEHQQTTAVRKSRKRRRGAA